MGAAFCRLLEQGEPAVRRMFDDPVVGRLVDPLLAAMAGPGAMGRELPESFGPGTYGSQVMRTRYIDEVVTALAEGGITQVVILGAGLDTRAYRLPALAGAIVFEADLPEDAAAEAAGARRGCARSRARSGSYRPTSPTGRWTATLVAAGLERHRPAVFVWEGVAQYLPEAAVRSTLAVIGASVPGSALVFTYVLRSVISAAAGPELGRPVAAAVGSLRAVAVRRRPGRGPRPAGRVRPQPHR